MNKFIFMGYTVSAICFSGFHLHYMLVDAWKQRSRSDITQKDECCWIKYRS